MMIGTFAITGVGIPLTHIGFAGFLSKDAIIESAWAGTNSARLFAFWALVISALFTSFYSWRLIFLTFFGEPRGDHHTHDHAHESPNTMLIPLGVLAAGVDLRRHDLVQAVLRRPPVDERLLRHSRPRGGGRRGRARGRGGRARRRGHGRGRAPCTARRPRGEAAPAAAAEGEHAAAAHGPGEVPGMGGAVFFGPENHVIDDAHHAPALVKASPFIAMLIGFGVAYLFYIVNPSLPVTLARQQPVLYRFLLNKWYFDELYDLLFVRPGEVARHRPLEGRATGARSTGSSTGWRWASCPGSPALAGRAQSGYLFHYAFAMVFGLVRPDALARHPGGS